MVGLRAIADRASLTAANDALTTSATMEWVTWNGTRALTHGFQMMQSA